ncbi:MAG TPA: hypothetical protein VGD67_12035 [Pseudonocardiaceae bacterium]
MTSPSTALARPADGELVVGELADRHEGMLEIAELTAQIQRLDAELWPHIAAALLDGAAPAAVAERAALTLSDLRRGVTEWSAAARQAGRLEQGAVVALANAVFGPAD